MPPVKEMRVSGQNIKSMITLILFYYAWKIIRNTQQTI